MGNWHPLKTSVNLHFASVDIGFLGVTISHVTLLCSRYLYNGLLSKKLKFIDFFTLAIRTSSLPIVS